MSDSNLDITELIDNIEINAGAVGGIEKEAIAPIIAAAGRALIPAARALVRPLVNSIAKIPGAPAAGRNIAAGAANQATKAQQWGKAIAADWTASGNAGKGILGSAQSAMQAGMKVSPGLTAGAIAAPGMIMGNIRGKSKTDEVAQQPETMIIKAEEEAELSKQAATENNKQDPLDLLVKGTLGGLAVGAGVAVGTKLKRVQVRNEEYLKATEGLRNIGKTTVPFYEQGLKSLEEQRMAPVKDISDPRLQRKFRDNLDDVSKLINETTKNLPADKLVEFKSALQKDFNTNKNNMPQGVKDEIWDMIDKI